MPAGPRARRLGPVHSPRWSSRVDRIAPVNARGDFLVIGSNFTPVVREHYHVGVPRGGWYEEILNTDSQHYDGSNVGNFPGVFALEQESHGRPFSLEVTLPPLATVIFKATSS